MSYRQVLKVSLYVRKHIGLFLSYKRIEFIILRIEVGLPLLDLNRSFYETGSTKFGRGLQVGIGVRNMVPSILIGSWSPLGEGGHT